MPINYILQKLDELCKANENLAHWHSNFKYEAKEEIKELKKRLQLLEQSQSKSKDKINK